MLPLRKDLVPRKGQPPGAAWIWGEEDELGRLNLLTPERILNAMKEATQGRIVNLNLPLDQPSPPMYGRAAFEHRLTQVAPHAFDEVYVVNPQSSSQWDGFHHFCHVPSGYFYNQVSARDIYKGGPKLGVQAWATHGIAGRGMLLDFGRYAQANGLQVKYFDNYKISHQTLVEVAASQGINLKPESVGGDIRVGDILLVRTGFLEHESSLSDEEKAKMHLRRHEFTPDDGQRYIGLEQSEEMLDFLHDSYFAAVVGDQPGFEAMPSDAGFYLHEHLLALWGCPIGELWDLDALASCCAANKKWTFFLASAPNNVRGGVGSMANAIAIL
ncbi:uncharacterized protein PV07_09011 [Cladophialophora immunda]|uniref:Cyclase n=1 Tax=Cladophialophora immunda TaxID=569365 RepID=A0A0D2C5V7_9EURO|nr:uncharacterized protein PV07_09011 [Cladophialophora immunda]KIW25875.1 hypothetical protein PV07_09011 [Cladophialophora immunda]OQV10428.1 hypothetical protein CLAIMM_14429 isoform 2 [Cladophialophora immunda]